MVTAYVRATRLTLNFVLAAAALGVLGCGSKPLATKAAALSLEVKASATVNPDARGRPSPVVVRIYELKSAAPFETADFLSLYEKDQTVLGAEVVVRDEFVLKPGESRTFRREIGESKVLAAMAAFRDLERSRWRAVAPIVTGSDNAFTITLDAVTLQLTKR